jgi:hypothetical protein
MGLDLYAGPLIRYYSGQWLTTVQLRAKEIGLSAEVVFQDGVSPWLQARKAKPAVRAFSRALSKRWGDRFPDFATG